MIVTREQLKAWFRKGMYPLESQFAAWIDSFVHKTDIIEMSLVEGLVDVLNKKANVDSITHKQDKTDDDLQTEDKTIVGAINEVFNRDSTPVGGASIGIGEDGSISVVSKDEHIIADKDGLRLHKVVLLGENGKVPVSQLPMNYNQFDITIQADADMVQQRIWDSIEIDQLETNNVRSLYITYNGARTQVTLPFTGTLVLPANTWIQWDVEKNSGQAAAAFSYHYNNIQ